MQATAVNPPATAASVPVAMVSFCSWPGSRRCTCMSISPGATTHPSGTSTTVAPSTGRPLPTRAIRPCSISTSAGPFRPLAGSTTSPPFNSSFTSGRLFFGATRQQVEDGHAHGDAVRDLLEDDGIGPVGHLGRDFHAAVHRAGMHDDGVVLRELRPLRRESELLEVLAGVREEVPVHPFLLDAEHHDHVGALDR